MQAKDETVLDPYREDPRVRGYVDELLHSSEGVPWQIHPDDDMYRYNLESLRGCRPCAAILYYSKGWQISSTVREVAASRFGGLGRIRSFLDVGSGWGRATRFLIGEIDPARICVAEVRPAAVEFQRRAFGVVGLVTTPDPESLDPGREFDCILAASFFSHLPEGRFRGWMRRLVEILDERGLLLLSTHGASLLEPGAGELPNGIAFFPESEAHDLDSSEYGTSYVTEDFVRRVVADATEGHARTRRFPKGLCAFQDLYVVTKDEEIDLENLLITNMPEGDLDRSALPESRLALEGWACDANGPRSLAAVRLTVNNREVAVWTPPETADTRSPQRWSFDVDRRDVAPDDVLIVSAFNGAGLQNILSMGTLRPYLAPAETPA